MRTSIYNATCWAENETNEAIKEEIKHCEQRYFKPYLWNSTENAQNTIVRIETLKEILNNRKQNT